jgi:hypothetical protein
MFSEKVLKQAEELEREWKKKVEQMGGDGQNLARPGYGYFSGYVEEELWIRWGRR